ncbi:uncharacterized protein LOC131631577 [Vicia villosa]|uniref:uncharacterized protein LOC131631577 n=1 Tax=Vicia villosa TaxID=3911 RepID=UPI00273B38B5|nr:uncharacterized protein LOC131631577 [Vicia villosa]
MIIQEEEDQQSKILYDLVSMIINTLKLPPLPFPFSTPYPSYSPSSASSSTSKTQPWWMTVLLKFPYDSPAVLVSLFLFVCLALMLFGSVIFLTGLLLLPWITVLVVVFYAAAFVSNVSFMGRFVLGSIGVALARGCSRGDKANILLKR